MFIKFDLQEILQIATFDLLKYYWKEVNNLWQIQFCLNFQYALSIILFELWFLRKYVLDIGIQKIPDLQEIN